MLFGNLFGAFWSSYRWLNQQCCNKSSNKHQRDSQRASKYPCKMQRNQSFQSRPKTSIEKPLQNQSKNKKKQHFSKLCARKRWMRTKTRDVAIVAKSVGVLGFVLDFLMVFQYFYLGGYGSFCFFGFCWKLKTLHLFRIRFRFLSTSNEIVNQINPFFVMY